MTSFRGSSGPRDQTHTFSISYIVTSGWEQVTETRERESSDKGWWCSPSPTSHHLRQPDLLVRVFSEAALDKPLHSPVATRAQHLWSSLFCSPRLARPSTSFPGSPSILLTEQPLASVNMARLVLADISPAVPCASRDGVHMEFHGTAYLSWPGPLMSFCLLCACPDVSCYGGT